MAGDGAIPESPKSKTLAGRAVRNHCSGHNGHRAAASAAAVLRTGTSLEGCADKAPTPSLDLLTTMIRAHAAESERALQKAASATSRIDAILANIADTKDSRRRQANATAPAVNDRWRARQLNVCVVGLIVVVGGSAFYVSEAGKEQPPAIAAAAEALEARSVVIGNANANDKPMERPLQTAEPGGSRTIGIEEQRIDQGGIGTKGPSSAHSNDRAVVTPVVGQPIEKPGSDTENRAGGAAGEPKPSEAVRTDSIPPTANASVDQPSRDAVPPPPAIPETGPAVDRTNDPAAVQVAGVTSGANMRPGPGSGEPVLATIPAGSANASAEEPSRDAVAPPAAIPEARPAVDRANDPVAVQVARVASGVNMRAGPGNGQPVLATIPRGSPIEVVKCAHWCEVIFAGQRGWVYKSFIRAPLADATVSPERTKPRPRKAGSNSHMLGGSRTWASDPRRLKPATARLATGQSARDAQSRGQSSNRPILWDTIVYLWKQIRPTALGPNSD
jgi:uncharacterized protein YraI